MVASRRPGERAGLTHDRVVAVARELLTDQGPDALTMRAVATRLGVSPNTLYSHVPSKLALLDDVLDDLLADVTAPDPDRGRWQAGLRSIMRSTYTVLVANADLVGLYLARNGARGPNAQHLGEVMLRLLARGGITGQAALDARRALIVHAIGSAAFAPRPLTGGDDDVVPDPVAMERSFRRSLDWLLVGIADTGAGHGPGGSPAPRGLRPGRASRPGPA